MKKAFYMVLAITALSLSACRGNSDASQGAADSIPQDSLSVQDSVRVDSLTGDTIYEEDAPKGVPTSKDDKEIAPPPGR